MSDQAEKLRQLAENENKERAADAGKAASHAVTIAIVSGKGGTGKSCFSVNFSISLALAGKRVLVLDADFGLSNLDVMYGTKPEFNLTHVLRGEKTLGEIVCRGYGGVYYIAGGAGAKELLSINKRQMRTILKQAIHMDEAYDYVIFDCGAGVNPQVLYITSFCDEALIVMTPEPTAVTDAFVLVKSIQGLKTPPPIRFVMNRVDSLIEAVTVAHTFKNVVSKYLACELGYLGYVSYDKNMVKSIKAQAPIAISNANSKATKDIRDLAMNYANITKRSFRGGLHQYIDKVLRKNEQQ